MIKKIDFPIFKEIIRNLFQKPVTINYPSESTPTPERYRGAPEVNPLLCTVCKTCERECPTHCINIIPIQSNNNLDSSQEMGEPFWFIINLGQCMFCQQCEENCPVGKKKSPAISLNSERWRLATDSIENSIEKTVVYKRSKNKDPTSF